MSTTPHSSQSSGEAFTPGPWFSDCRDEVCATLDGGAVVVIALANPMAELNEPTTEANARLIAASPTMFDYIAQRAAAGDAEAAKIVEAIRASR